MRPAQRTQRLGALGASGLPMAASERWPPSSTSAWQNYRPSAPREEGGWKSRWKEGAGAGAGLASDAGNYVEHPSVAARRTAEVTSWRIQHGVLVDDQHERAHKPVLSFDEAPFPGWARESFDRLQLTEPTPVQAQAWPIAVSGRDLIGISETGSGKTLAYGLPVLVRSMGRVSPPQENKVQPQGVIMLPTIELAMQVCELLQDVARGAVGVGLLYGTAPGPAAGRDHPADDGTCYAGPDTDVLIATPERLAGAWCMAGGAPYRGKLDVDISRVAIIAIDEADDLLQRALSFHDKLPNSAHGAPVARLLQFAASERRQVLYFSATWPDRAEEACKTFRLRGMPPLLHVGEKGLSACKGVSQHVQVCGAFSKFEKLVEKLACLPQCEQLRGESSQEEMEQVLIFVNSDTGVTELVEKLQEEGWHSKGLHSALPEDERIQILDSFREGGTILVATSRIARGHHFPSVKFVINYDWPAKAVEYVHRVGRCARNGQEGSSMTFLTSEDMSGSKQEVTDLARVLFEGGQDMPPELQRLVPEHQLRGNPENDWYCNECGAHQFETRNKCRACGTPRPRAATELITGWRAVESAKESAKSARRGAPRKKGRGPGPAASPPPSDEVLSPTAALAKRLGPWPPLRRPAPAVGAPTGWFAAQGASRAPLGSATQAPELLLFPPPDAPPPLYGPDAAASAPAPASAKASSGPRLAEAAAWAAAAQEPDPPIVGWRAVEAAKRRSRLPAEAARPKRARSRGLGSHVLCSRGLSSTSRRGSRGLRNRRGRQETVWPPGSAPLGTPEPTSWAAVCAAGVVSEDAAPADRDCQRGGSSSSRGSSGEGSNGRNESPDGSEQGRGGRISRATPCATTAHSGGVVCGGGGDSASIASSQGGSGAACGPGAAGSAASSSSSSNGTSGHHPSRVTGRRGSLPDGWLCEHCGRFMLEQHISCWQCGAERQGGSGLDEFLEKWGVVDDKVIKLLESLPAYDRALVTRDFRPSSGVDLCASLREHAAKVTQELRRGRPRGGRSRSLGSRLRARSGGA